MAFERENTTITAGEVLGAIAAGQDIRLTRCEIAGSVDFNVFLADDFIDAAGLMRKTGDSVVMTLPQTISFNACQFDGDVLFAGPWEQADAIKVVFEQDVVFNLSKFTGQTRFAHAEFKGTAGFDGCTFCQVCSFQQVDFHGRAMFRTVSFDGYGLFSKARFGGDVRFANSTFGKGSNFAKACFEDRCDFAGVFARSKAVPIYEGAFFTRKRHGDDESFWRFIKQACQEAGYYQQAGECFYAERCGHFWHKFRGVGYEKLTGLQRLMRWVSGARLLPEFIFGRMLFGYGERPIRVLIAAAMIILLCGLFYSSSMAKLTCEVDEHYTSRLFDGLYYSTITFTTLGLGDICPQDDVLTRLVTMVESLCGLSLMSLFIVCLAKRFSRG
ncbi:MAG: potassium channel family protein [Planctomycetota bacterium]